MRTWWNNLRLLLWGDWLVLALSIVLLFCLWAQFTPGGQAQKCQIRQAGRLLGTYDLQQERHISVSGRIGNSLIHIHQGRVRFEHAPCHNQYCVQQGWLNRAGQVALCLPNEVSIHLLGERGFDSLSY